MKQVGYSQQTDLKIASENESITQISEVHNFTPKIQNTVRVFWIWEKYLQETSSLRGKCLIVVANSSLQFKLKVRGHYFFMHESRYSNILSLKSHVLRNHLDQKKECSLNSANLYCSYNTYYAAYCVQRFHLLIKEDY